MSFFAMVIPYNVKLFSWWIAPPPSLPCPLSPLMYSAVCFIIFIFLFIIMMVITHSSDINLKSNLGLLAVRFLHCSRIKKVKNQMIYDSISYGSFYQPHMLPSWSLALQLWGKDNNFLTSCRADEVCRVQDVKCNTGYRHLERSQSYWSIFKKSAKTPH